MFPNRQLRGITPGQPSNLAARVEEKRAELENLKELKLLSTAMAEKMEVLQEKLETLTDGTEAIALVMANWHNVLRAIHLASTKIPIPNADPADDQPVVLPQTLVRVPVEELETSK